MKELSFELPDTDERGVSPVIGVILMVAITVILAAVIASFVLGFGDSVSQNVQAGADVTEKDDGNVTVTWISEGNAQSLNVTQDGTNTAFVDGEKNMTAVGQSVEIETTATETITVTVVAVGEGGSKTVITQEEVTVEA